MRRDDDPERRRALSVYASGDRIAALEALVSGQEQRDAIASKERAAHWRQIGALAIGVDSQLATDAFERSLRDAPGDYEGSLILVDLYIQMGRADQALLAATRAAESAPEGLARFHATLGAARSHLALGHVERSAEYFDRARAELVDLLRSPTLAGEALRLSFYFAFQYGSFLSALGSLIDAERWFNGQIPFLRDQLSDPAFAADIQTAYPITLVLASANSMRLGLKEPSLSRVRELHALIQPIDLDTVEDSNLLMVLSNAYATISSVELRFDATDRARGAVELALRAARMGVRIDPNNVSNRMVLVFALALSCWVETLSGNLARADGPAAEALAIARDLRNTDRQEFFTSLTLALALLYRGVERFLARHPGEAASLVNEGLTILRPFGDLSPRNATLGLTVWYLRAASAAFDLGESWEQFVIASEQLVRAGSLTPSELDYVRSVRLRLFDLYSVATAQP